MKNQESKIPPARSFLDPKKLQSGDVLLTRGSGKEADCISLASRGHYSHAEMFFEVNDGADFATIEANEHGVWKRRHEYVSGTFHHQRVRWIAIPHRASDFIVLRHEDLTNRGNTAIQKSLGAAYVQFGGSPYSLFTRLIDASDIPDWLRPPAKLILALKDNRDISSPLPGYFCSELVVLLMRCLNIQLFPENRAPESVSPSDLETPQMHKVEATVSEADASILRIVWDSSVEKGEAEIQLEQEIIRAQEVAISIRTAIKEMDLTHEQLQNFISSSEYKH